jgi:hypothetical protein
MIFEGSTGASSVSDESARGAVFCALAHSGISFPANVLVTWSWPLRVSTSPYLGPSGEEKRQYFMVMGFGN